MPAHKRGPSTSYPEAIGKHSMSSVSLINCCSECDLNAKAAVVSGFKPTKISLCVRRGPLDKDNLQKHENYKAGWMNVKNCPLVLLTPVRLFQNLTYVTQDHDHMVWSTKKA